MCTVLESFFAPLVVLLMQLLGKIYTGDNDGMESTRGIFGGVPRVPAGMVFVPVGTKSAVYKAV